MKINQMSRFSLPLDVVAATLTGLSTPLLATGHKVGFLTLIAGSACWAGVAVKARYNGRAIWPQFIMSLWTIGWAVWGFSAWSR